MIPPVEVTTTVAASPAEAFRIFTEEIDSWWLSGPRFRPHPERLGVLHLDPFAGGRLVERYADGDVALLGTVSRYQPPTCDATGHLGLDLRGRDFGPGESTHVEIAFRGCPTGTRVDVRHGGWELLPAGHPALRGLEGVALTSLIGLWWADLFGSLSRRAARRAKSTS